ncbi:larval cuticle protein 65Ag1 [Drosophila grimshawi]|uniref:GH15651 n=1 Tax=Drosophila grimshawi TaxID=7222 RepID=B4IZT5_DROGR|nr:larval cuticle protein 65Ag1 [Drosophila grimshawi]EDV95670.1 GH15651 [Drosophila grimshawi]
MKFLIVFVALFAIALARPDIEVVRQDSDVGPESFKFSVETSDGTKREEEGQLKNAGTDNEYIAVHGSFSYVADDGKTYSVVYTADENGFQPKGDHIPVA